MPPKKKTKKEEVMRLPLDGSKSGIIRFEVDEVSTLDEDGRVSPEIEVEGLSWWASVHKEKQYSSDEDALAVYLHTKPNVSPMWSVDLVFEMFLVQSDSNVKEVITTKYDRNRTGYGSDMLDWEEFIDEEKGFIKDDKITVEIRFNVKKTRGIRTTPRIDFSDPNEPIHDVALIIEGEKVYVSKQILAANSPFFKVMLFGNFDDKNKKEIPLKDVDREEFLEMLRVIYPDGKKITDDNVGFLLKLGDRFQIKSLLDLCENFLIDTATFYLSSKLLLSDKYILVKLQDHCLSQLKTMADVAAIKNSEGYKELSDAIKVALLERIVR